MDTLTRDDLTKDGGDFASNLLDAIFRRATTKDPTLTQIKDEERDAALDKMYQAYRRMAAAFPEKLTEYGLRPDYPSLVEDSRFFCIGPGYDAEPLTDQEMEALTDEVEVSDEDVAEFDDDCLHLTRQGIEMIERLWAAEDSDGFAYFVGVMEEYGYQLRHLVAPVPYHEDIASLEKDIDEFISRGETAVFTRRLSNWITGIFYT